MGMLNWEEIGLYDEIDELGGIVNLVKSVNFDLINEGKIIRYYKLEIEISNINRRYKCLNIFNKEERDKWYVKFSKLKSNGKIADFRFSEYREFKDIVLVV